MNLLKSNDKYYSYRDNQLTEVGDTPTSNDFIEHGILDLSILTTPTNKMVVPMEYSHDLEDGKVYKKMIDINDYDGLERIDII